jgi:DNA-binding CsgD family transcriptional regulator
VSAPLPRQRQASVAVRVALRIADPVLRERIALALRAAGDFASPERREIDVPGEADVHGEADVIIADHATGDAAPVIALAPAQEAAAWPSNVRAVLPTAVDATLLGAAITVVAAGLTIAPIRGAADQVTTGRWAEGFEAEAFDPAGAEEEAAAHEDSVVLTAREREVLALLAAGASNKAIARALGVSVHTAKFHVASLTEKLGARGRLEAVAIALRAGLIMV